MVTILTKIAFVPENVNYEEVNSQINWFIINFYIYEKGY